MESTKASKEIDTSKKEAEAFFHANKASSTTPGLKKRAAGGCNISPKTLPTDKKHQKKNGGDKGCSPGRKSVAARISETVETLKEEVKKKQARNLATIVEEDAADEQN